MFTKKGDGAVLAKLGDAPAQYREIGERLHAIIMESAPSLEPIVRWGLPFYQQNGKDICYIKPNQDFIAFGFGDEAGVNGDGKFDKVEHTGEVNRLVKMHCMKTPETKGEEEEEEEE